LHIPHPPPSTPRSYLNQAFCQATRINLAVNYFSFYCFPCNKSIYSLLFLVVRKRAYHQDARRSANQPLHQYHQNRTRVSRLKWCFGGAAVAVYSGAVTRTYAFYYIFPTFVLSACLISGLKKWKSIVCRWRLRADVNGHQQPNGQPSQYIDPKYVDGGNQFNPALVAQQAQDPAHPANPNHPKVCFYSTKFNASCYIKTMGLRGKRKKNKKDLEVTFEG